MTETPAGGSAPTPRASRTPTKAPTKNPVTGNRSSLTAIAALVTAVIAVVLAILGWFHPTAGPGSFSEQATQDAKQKTCEAQATVRASTQINTNLPSPPDPIGALAVASNARLALSAGGAYLREQVAAQPAAPAELRDAAIDMADTMQALAINYLAGAGPDSPVQQPLRERLRGEIDVLNGLCQQQ